MASLAQIQQMKTRQTQITSPVILLIDQGDNSYLDYVKRLVPIGGISHIINLSYAEANKCDLITISDVAVKLKQIKNVESCTLITTNSNILKQLINLNGIWVDETKAKPISTENWQGAMFRKAYGDKIPVKSIDTVLFIPPLKNCYTRSEGAFCMKRFLYKVFNPADFLPDVPFNWRLIQTEQEAQEFYELILREGVMLSTDIETVRKHHLISCVGYSLLTKYGQIITRVFPMGTNMKTFLDNLKWVRLINLTDIPKVLQNGRYDALYFLRWSAPMVNWRYDTYLMSHALFSELPRGLGDLSGMYLLNHKYWKDEGRAGEIMMLYEYNAKDCHRTLLVHLNQLHFIARYKDRFGYAIDNFATSFRLVFPCLQVEAEGIAVDEERRQIVYKRESEKAEKLLAQLHACVGKPINPNSSKQVNQLLKAILCGNLAKKHGTDAKGLDSISFESPFAAILIELIAEMRKVNKVIGTYIDIAGVDSDKESVLLHGRLHYAIDPGRTDTSRLASKESGFWCGRQIQNMPRDPDMIKYFLMADEGFILSEIDMAQSEARGTAHLSNCERMIYACEQSPDFHSYQTALFFGVKFEDVWDIEKNKPKDKGLRDLAKRVNHGSNYNMGAFVLLTTMGIRKVLEAQKLLKLNPRLKPIEVCELLIGTFEKTYPEIKQKWYREIIDEVKRTKTLTLPSLHDGLRGWTRYCFGDPTKSKLILNSYVAHKPQALSVQTSNNAFYQCWAQLQGPDFRLKAQIHDSIFSQIRIGKEEEYGKKVKEIMELPILMDEKTGRHLLVPCDIGNFGKYWSDLK